MLTWAKLWTKENLTASLLCFPTNTVQELAFQFSCVVVEEVANFNLLAKSLAILPRCDPCIFVGPGCVVQRKPGIGIVGSAAAGVLALAAELKCWRVLEERYFTSFLLHIAHRPPSIVIRNTVPIHPVSQLEGKITKVVGCDCCVQVLYRFSCGDFVCCDLWFLQGTLQVGGFRNGAWRISWSKKLFVKSWKDEDDLSTITFRTPSWNLIRLQISFSVDGF